VSRPHWSSEPGEFAGLPFQIRITYKLYSLE
jgi:hypothetical protein